MTFCLDGTLKSNPTCVNGGAGYLLRDFKAQAQPSQTNTQWTFSLPTAHWVDGTHTLLAVVTMRDGSQTHPVAVSVSFANGNATQPRNGRRPTISTGTRPAKGAPLVVAAVGDGAGGDSGATTVAALISRMSPNLFLYLGDVYEDGSYAEFTNWYGGTFGALRPITDPVPGNHEYASRNDPASGGAVVPAGVAYFDYWNNLPNYYSFDAGGWHFIALNANATPMGGPAWKSQLSWLQADLASHARACTIAMWHQPAFNIGREPVPASAVALWRLVAGHATLVLNGHDHTYQRWTAMDANGVASSAGTVEIVAGTGGHAGAAFTRSDPRVRAERTTAGALRLALTSTAASLRFVDTAGTVVDSTSVPCIR